MGNNFKKLKTKYLLIALLKSAAVGISCGLIAVGAVLLALKLCSININIGYYVLIDVGTALIIGASLFGILYKLCLTDKKIAERLDNEYGLRERVQTSVAFNEDNSEIVAVLKADTESVLGNLPRLPFNFKKFLKEFWYCLVCVVLALALFITALCIPPRVEPEIPPEIPPVYEEPDPDPYYVYDLETQGMMFGLRRDVINSNMAQSEKSAFDGVLESLHNELLKTFTGEKQIRTSEVALLVITKICEIDIITDNANTFRKISESLKDVDENLSKAIIEGVILYKSYTSNYNNLTELNSVNGLYGRVSQDVDGTVEKYFTASLEENKFDDDTETVTDGTQLSAFAAKLKTALNGSGADEGDALYTAIGNFAEDGINSVLDMVGNGWTPARVNDRLKIVYDDFKTSSIDGLLVQSYNCIMDVYVRRKLSEIFGVPIREIGEPYEDLIPEGSGSDENPGDGDGNNNGGYGEGNDIYGSKDLIYDPDKGVQVEYGNLYSEYYSLVDERLRNGDLPEDISAFIAEYFNILQNGTRDEGSEDN